MGNTGDSHGQHLHFEIHKGKWNYQKSNAVDSKLYIIKDKLGSVVKLSKRSYTLKNGITFCINKMKKKTCIKRRFTVSLNILM